MNRRAKFDAARFILVGEIRNPTNKQTNKITNIHLAYRRVCITKTKTEQLNTGSAEKEFMPS